MGAATVPGAVGSLLLDALRAFSMAVRQETVFVDAFRTKRALTESATLASKRGTEPNMLA